MKKRALILGLALLLVHFGYSQKKEVHILAVNDMHAAIEAFPQLSAIADSLRTLYPSLLIMVALMNLMGFDATTLGNHEFDSNSLPIVIPHSGFSYICANIFPSEETGLHIIPTKVFDVDGLKVGVIGVIQINQQGRPDTHPDNLKGIKFCLPKNAIRQYENFSHHCDVTILLSQTSLCTTGC